MRGPQGHVACKKSCKESRIKLAINVMHIVVNRVMHRIIHNTYMGTYSHALSYMGFVLGHTQSNKYLARHVRHRELYMSSSEARMFILILSIHGPAWTH